MSRYVSIGHRLTGWNAVKSRAQQIGLDLTDEQIKAATNRIKVMADIKDQTMEDVDSVLHVFHRAIKNGQDVSHDALFDKLFEQHTRTRGQDAIAAEGEKSA